MADIVLRDRNGNQVEYPGIESIKLNTVGGGTKEFIDPDTAPQAVEKTIDPDFSAGDMEVIPEDGQVFSKVGISMPTNLLPGNIAEGVDIAGIIGTLMASSSAKFATGRVSGTMTISHNLGVVPDFAIFFRNPSSGVSSKYIYLVAYMSDALKNALGLTKGGFYTYADGSSQLKYGYSASSATDTEISFSSVGGTLNGTYCWIAIGGLT